MSSQLSKEGNKLAAKRFPTLVHPRRVGRDFQKTAAAISEKGAYRAENGGPFLWALKIGLPSLLHRLPFFQRTGQRASERARRRPFLYLSVTLIKAINCRSADTPLQSLRQMGTSSGGGRRAGGPVGSALSSDAFWLVSGGVLCSLWLDKSGQVDTSKFTH